MPDGDTLDGVIQWHFPVARRARCIESATESASGRTAWGGYKALTLWANSDCGRNSERKSRCGGKLGARILHEVHCIWSTWQPAVLLERVSCDFPKTGGGNCSDRMDLEILLEIPIDDPIILL